MSDEHREYSSATARLEALPAAGVVLGGLGGLLGMPLLAALPSPGLRAGGLALLLLCLLALAFAARRPKPLPEGSRLRFSREGIHCGERLLLSRGEVDNGAVVPRTDQEETRVLLGKKGSLSFTHTLRVRDAAEAQRVLEALGLDAAHSTFAHREAGPSAYNARIYSGLAALFGASAAGFLPLLVALHGSALAALLPGLAMVAFFGTLWGTRSEVVVGADGVSVRWLGYQRFCAWSEVLRVEPRADGFALHRREGEPFVVRVNVPQRAAFAAADRALLLERLEEALRVHRECAEALDPATLARGERSLSDWLSSLRGLLGRATHRAAALLPEHLWQLVADPRAPAPERAAAAAALAPGLDDAGKARLRAAAESTASTHLRVALESAASGDEAQLAASLEALSPPKSAAERG